VDVVVVALDEEMKLKGGCESMQCKSCQSARNWKCPAEINIHPPAGMENLSKPAVWAFPRLRVCGDCGFVEFVLEESELKRLTDVYSGEPFCDALVPCPGNS